MLELDELKAQMKTYEEPMQQMRSSLDLDNKEKRIEELERTMAEPGFWENPENAQKLQKELGSLRNGIEAYSNQSFPISGAIWTHSGRTSSPCGSVRFCPGLMTPTTRL